MTVKQAIDKAVKRKIEELAAFYNTYGYESEFSRMAEHVLVNDEKDGIEKARTIVAQARNLL